MADLETLPPCPYSDTLRVVRAYLANPAADGSWQSLLSLRTECVRDVVEIDLGGPSEVPVLAFTLVEANGVKQRVTCNPATFALGVVFELLGHGLFLNRRAAGDGNLNVRVGKEREMIRGNPRNLQFSRIISFAEEGRNVKLLDGNNLNLRHENIEAGQSQPRTQFGELSVYEMFLTSTSSLDSLFGNSPSEVHGAKQRLLTDALECVWSEREMALAKLKK